MVSTFVRAFSIAVLCLLVGCMVDDENPARRRRRSEDGAPPPPAGEATTSGVRRISQREYDNVVRDLLGDTTRPSQTRLPSETRSPFDNAYASQDISAALVEGAEFLATSISARVLADAKQRDKIVGCAPKGPEDAECFRHFLVTFGRKILRHPVSDEELSDFMGVLAIAGEEKDFYAAVDVALRAFLQHPRFLYRLEIGEPVENRPELRRLTDWEVATRLSFFLWGSTPDDRLLDRAAEGRLRTVEHIREAAGEMVKDPRASELVTSFHAMWLGYEKLGFDPVLAPAMKAETDALFTRIIVDEKRPWQDVLRLRETFVTDALATHYGLPTHGSDAGAWTTYEGTERRGLLSQGAFLTLGSRGDEPSPTLRGKAVRQRLLCQTIPPPPPGTKADEPPPLAGRASCKKERYAQHAAGSCAGCHRQMDPIGFGLENFDGRGRFRATEPGSAECSIDGNGEVAGVGTFHGPGELGDLLLGTKGLTTCIATQVYRFMSGRVDIDDADRRIVTELANARPADFRFDELLVDVAAQSAFLFRRVEP
jgi:hypothetical protein